MSHLVLSKANKDSKSYRSKINLSKITWVACDSTRIWTKGPFSDAILLQLSAKFRSCETPLSLILIETYLYWGYYQPRGFSGPCTLQQISLYLTSWQSAWGSGRSLWWGWEPLGGSHTMECHWYSPAHHQSSSSGTRLPCLHLQSVLQRTKQKAGGEVTPSPKFYFLAPPNLWATWSPGGWHQDAWKNS